MKYQDEKKMRDDMLIGVILTGMTILAVGMISLHGIDPSCLSSIESNGI